jgi:hypothetical protein
MDRYQGETTRAAAPHGDCLSALQVAEICSHVPGGKDVRQEQNLFIGETFRNFVRSDIGVGDAHVFRLSAG